MVIKRKSQTSLQGLKVHYIDWFSLLDIYAKAPDHLQDLETSETATLILSKFSKVDKFEFVFLASFKEF